MYYQTVLDFWFGQLGHDTLPKPAYMKRWWQKDPAFDQDISQQFAATIDAIVNGEHDDWLASPKGRLATIIALDQFPRQCYRDTPRAFAYDEQALALTKTGIEHQLDTALAPIFRTFFYMPLEHAEDIEAQLQSVELFNQLYHDANAAHKALFANYYDFAKRHYDIIARFGRFPHRNAILQRQSTQEELDFLTEPHSSL